MCDIDNVCMFGIASEHAHKRGCGHVLCILCIPFPMILVIASSVKTHNSLSKESRIQKPTYGIVYLVLTQHTHLTFIVSVLEVSSSSTCRQLH